MKHQNQKSKSMYRWRLLLSLALLISIWQGCKKENDDAADLSPNNNQNAYRILTTPSYKGIYVDGFSMMIGDTAAENNMLRWCKKESINALSLYDTKALLLSSSSFPKLAKFIKKSRTQYGIKSVAAVRSLGSQFTGSTSTYNNSRSDTLEKFNVFNLENEFWNGDASNTFGDWYKSLSTMYSTAKAAKPVVTSEFYFGWFQNPVNKEVAQAAKMISTTDRILLHDYWASPNFSYMQGRLSILGQEALKQNKIIDVIVIFSIEPSFAYDYFDNMSQNHSFLDAYNSILSQHNAASFAGKDNIRIIGYQLYCQSWARRARP